ncbi:MAG TPA: SpoIID/LytB domain-containing protein [Candidatus Eremiobacteraceae bacterium]|jgi:stage II sporulation protein D
MRRRRFTIGFAAGAASFALLPAHALARTSAAQTAAPQSSALPARTIRVRLFTGQSLIRADVTGANADGTPVLFSFDANTTFKPTVIGGGVPLTVTAYDADGLVASRRYAGAVTVAGDSAGLLIINTVDSESYTASVLAAEMSPNWHVEALKAQAIATRTYAFRAATKSKKSYDLGDDTSAQVYRGMDAVADRFTSAAQATVGLALFAGDAVADVFYSSACGGHTASSSEINGGSAPPYLRGIADVDRSGNAYCAKAPYYSWQNLIPSGALERIFDLEPGDLADVDASATWPDGRVKSVKAHSRRGFENTMDGRVFYGRCGALLGYKVVPSTMFRVASDTGGFRFTGHGNGHGIGMCQWGARGRADAGMNAAAILAAYFPGTAPRQA